MTGTRTVPGTPAWLRARNDRTALQLLLDHGSLTRNQLGELTGLSKPTASQIVQRLESADLVETAGAVSAGRGPNASIYAVRTDQALGVAIDFDERESRATVVDVIGAVRPSVVIESPRAPHTPVSDIRSCIAAACDAAGVHPDRIDAVCVGLQGAVDPRTDRLSFADTLGGWPQTDVRAHLERELGITVLIENDVNLAAIAERAVGAGRELGGFALLWLGEGLGLAADLGGVLHRGASGGAGEIGYLPVPRAAAALDPDAAQLQDLIGGGPVLTLTRAAGADVSGYDDAIAAIGADPALRDRVVSALAPRVALGVAPVVALLDPERVILGGPTGTACGAALAEAVTAEIRRTTAWSPDVAASGVPQQPVLTGAREQLLTTLRATLFDRLDRLAP
jgi:predicted NBD/HSP70 family sugar kinase